MTLISRIAHLVERLRQANNSVGEWLAHGFGPLHEWSLYDDYRPDRPRRGPRISRPVMARKINGSWEVRPLTAAEANAYDAECEAIEEQAARSL